MTDEVGHQRLQNINIDWLLAHDGLSESIAEATIAVAARAVNAGL